MFVVCLFVVKDCLLIDKKIRIIIFDKIINDNKYYNYVCSQKLYSFKPVKIINNYYINNIIIVLLFTLFRLFFLLALKSYHLIRKPKYL